MQRMDFHTIEFEKVDGIGFLRLNQPPSNKMSRVFFKEFKVFIDDLLRQEAPGALIIMGKGRHFSSGADIDDLLSAFDELPMIEKACYPSFFEDNRKTFQALSDLEIPVIAAIQGVCLGSALELALFCHFRFCADGALLALPEVSFNLIPGCGGTQRLQQLCDRKKALELMMEGRNFSPQEALEWGIIDRVTDRKELLESAIAFAKQICEGYIRDKKSSYLK